MEGVAQVGGGDRGDAARRLVCETDRHACHSPVSVIGEGVLANRPQLRPVLDAGGVGRVARVVEVVAADEPLRRGLHPVIGGGGEGRGRAPPGAVADDLYRPLQRVGAVRADRAGVVREQLVTEDVHEPLVVGAPATTSDAKPCRADIPTAVGQVVHVCDLDFDDVVRRRWPRSAGRLEIGAR